MPGFRDQVVKLQWSDSLQSASAEWRGPVGLQIGGAETTDGPLSTGKGDSQSVVFAKDRERKAKDIAVDGIVWQAEEVARVTTGLHSQKADGVANEFIAHSRTEEHRANLSRSLERGSAAGFKHCKHGMIPATRCLESLVGARCVPLVFRRRTGRRSTGTAWDY